jgi:hypothetical protein
MIQKKQNNVTGDMPGLPSYQKNVNHNTKPSSPCPATTTLEAVKSSLLVSMRREEGRGHGGRESHVSSGTDCSSLQEEKLRYSQVF